jgi:hypothetical protein
MRSGVQLEGGANLTSWTLVADVACLQPHLAHLESDLDLNITIKQSLVV